MRLALVVGLSVLCTAIAPAHADDCTVVLCLLNPAGWASVNACVPPVQGFISAVAAGGGAPSCPGGNGGMSIGRGKRANERVIEFTDADGVRQRIAY